MGLIQKIVLTPIKWVSKKVLHQTLFRFPGGDPQSPVACVYCPEMCRFSCPSAVVSANDAVTPCNKMSFLYKEIKWPSQSSAAVSGGAMWPIYDCTGCGRCSEYCLYDMPVFERLFEARKKLKWDVALEVAAKLTDEEDPVGDLADELGDEFNAKRRMNQFIRKHTFPAGLESIEPKSFFFLKQNGFFKNIKWNIKLSFKDQPALFQMLDQKKWLLHESVWMSRHLDQCNDLQEILNALEAAGIHIVRPFAQGHDCIDCGGEGIYSGLFPSQAKQMARDIWEQDQNRVDGILCVSQRCAKHLKASVGTQVPVMALHDIQ